MTPHASADEVAERLIESRRLSMVVVDDDGRPIGRILADDVLDALVPTKGRFHFPRLLSVRPRGSPRRWLIYLAAAGPGSSPRPPATTRVASPRTRRPAPSSSIAPSS